jgi:copper chaperone CopZ
VELNNRSAVIESTTPVEAVRDVVKAIRDNGYDVPTLRRTFPVTGMTCASCVSSVESMLLAQPGVLNAAVNLATNTVQVEYVPGVIDERRMRAVVQSIGYDLLIGERARGHRRPGGDPARTHELLEATPVGLHRTEHPAGGHRHVHDARALGQLRDVGC